MISRVRLPERRDSAILAVFTVFTLSGVAFASWASRVPQVRDQLGLSTRELGLLLLALPSGAVVALFLAGPLVTAWGPRRALARSSAAAALGLAGIGVGANPAVRAVALVVVGLVLLGLSTGIWDVAMSVAATGLESARGRVLMPRFHAASSAGSVTGASVGALATAAHLSVTGHLVAVAAMIGVGVIVSVGRLQPNHAASAEGDQPADRPHSALQAWREPRTLLLGLLVLTAAFSEGSANDWLAVAMADGHQAAPALASTTFAIFVAAMTLGRWYGNHLVERFGAVKALRLSGALGIAGLLLLVFAPSPALAVAGACAWGLGTALGFPLGISAAGRTSSHAAARVSVVSTIGYTAFLAGPPLLGFVGQHTGALRALLVTAGVIALGAMNAGAVRDVRPAPGEGRLDAVPTQVPHA